MRQLKKKISDCFSILYKWFSTLKKHTPAQNLRGESLNVDPGSDAALLIHTELFRFIVIATIYEYQQFGLGSARGLI